MGRWAADFETTTKPPVKVWLWAVSLVDDPEDFQTGETIETFLEWLEKCKDNPTVYFHNQKFDGMFILYHLLSTGWNWKRPAEKGKCQAREFTCIVDENGRFFSIEIYFKRKGRKVKKASIFDSCKLLPFALDKAAQHFGLTLRKLSIDYDAHNNGEPVTDGDLKYIEHDVKILAQLMQICTDYGLTGFTIGSCAMADYRKDLRGFRTLFPVLCHEDEKALRAAYKGGWMFLNPDYAEQEIGAGVALDNNSLYGACMAKYPMPYGYPVEFEGEYQENKNYPLYVQTVFVSFHIKNDHLPFIQARGTPQFVPAQYLYDTGGQLVRLVLSSVDLELLREHYIIDDIIYMGGFMFKSSTNLFKDWIGKWSEIKYRAGDDKNPSLRMIAKLMIVSLYGKFATNPEKKAVKPVYDQHADNIIFRPSLHKCTDRDGEYIKNELGETEETDIELVQSYYLPVGIFTTAYARRETIEAAQRIHLESLKATGKSRFVYAATDSLHLIGDQIPDFLEIDQRRTGAWKIENRFRRAKFIGINRYVEEIGQPDGSTKLKIRCSGLPEKMHYQITFDNFNADAEYDGQLRPKSVPGGVVLVQQKFHMKRKKDRRIAGCTP